jgi:aminoglycoside phosphotransferase (APT) family kinase protein
MVAPQNPERLMAGRRNIYYWKSDRAFASENTRTTARSSLTEVTIGVEDYLNRFFRKGLITIMPAHGQGNHITFIAKYADTDYFIRLENGPEADNYMAVESGVMKMVREQGVPCPVIYHTDVSRTAVPFAIQVMERVDCVDLNQHVKAGKLDTEAIAFEIGKYIARWQAISPAGFGLFDIAAYMSSGQLQGYHQRYADYFLLNFDRHVDLLVQEAFLPRSQSERIHALVRDHESLLHLGNGCLVHKDLAFWNILGDNEQIAAFIDWDDAISGDPVDDLSLLACFHEGGVVSAAVNGYSEIRALPSDFIPRFWLHLLRNMLFKAVIRVRGNYFDMPGDFFMNNGKNNHLRQFTLARIQRACEGLAHNHPISNL